MLARHTKVVGLAVAAALVGCGQVESNEAPLSKDGEDTVVVTSGLTAPSGWRRARRIRAS